MKKPVLKKFVSLDMKVDPPLTIGETGLGLDVGFRFDREQ